MTINLIAAFVGIYASLQVLSMVLTNMNLASKQVEGRKTWTAADGTTFEEFSVGELESSEIMKQDFEVTQAESIMAHHFAGVSAN